MNKDRLSLISNLSQDLEVIQHPGQTFWIAFSWVVTNFFLVMLLTFATGPFRPGSFDQLQHHPQFFIESLIGLSAIIMLAFAAFKSAVPTPRSVFKLSLVAPLFLLLVWLLFYIFGLWSPAMPASMVGKREVFCEITTLIIGLPGLVIGLLIIRKLWPLHTAWSGLLIGLASGATPALIMQFACMYSVGHILLFHLLPGLLLGLVGMISGKYFLQK